MSGAETFFVFKPVNYKKTGLDQFEELWYLSLVLQFNDLFISQITEHTGHLLFIRDWKML